MGPAKKLGRSSRVGELLKLLARGRDALLREQKAAIQKEFMVARRMLERAYADFAADELPVDLQRLRHDLELTRDERVADTQSETEEMYALATEAIISVGNTYPGFYTTPVTDRHQKRADPENMPAKVREELEPEQVAAVCNHILGVEEGLTSVEVCARMRLTHRPAQLGVRRLLTWLRAGGYVKTDGARTTSMRYIARPKLRMLAERVARTAEHGD